MYLSHLNLHGNLYKPPIGARVSIIICYSNSRKRNPSIYPYKKDFTFSWAKIWEKDYQVEDLLYYKIHIDSSWIGFDLGTSYNIFSLDPSFNIYYASTCSI